MTEVDLDPDGLAPILLVEAPTGIVYLHQCGGVTCLQRRLTGFLVPLASHHGAAAQLRAMFHDGNACVWGQGFERPASDRLERLATLVASLSDWDPLALDEHRLGEVVEGLVPVTTRVHPTAWLLWANCD